jgi:uncharacterized delta-60 repeat protein
LFGQAMVFDNSFGTNGLHKAVITGNLNGYTDMQILTDQKIICLGSKGLTDSTDQVFLAKYNSNGTLDATFGSNGISSLLGSGSTSLATSVMDVQQDGKIVFGVAEYLNNNITTKIVRYNANGSIDNTFGVNGITSVQYSTNNSFVEKVDLQSDGKIVASIQCSFDSSYIVRLLANGNIDVTFGTNGYVKIPTVNTGKYFGPLKVLNDGSILVSGYRGYSNAGQPFNELYIYKYTTSGVLDNSFGTSGVFIYNDNNVDIYPTNIDIQSDNKIIVGGYKASTFSNAFLIRVNTNGTIDNSFGVNGIALYSEPNLDCNLTRRFKITPDNKITCLISKYDGNGNESLSLTRFNSNGTSDNTFNDISAFKDLNNLPYIVSEDLGSVDVQADGKVVFVTTETDATYTNFNSVIGRLIPSSTTSVENVEINSNYTLMPIPANDFLQILSKNNVPASICLTDMNGKIIFQDNMQGTKILNVSKFANGVYIVHIKTESENVSAKIVIKH